MFQDRLGIECNIGQKGRGWCSTGGAVMTIASLAVNTARGTEATGGCRRAPPPLSSSWGSTPAHPTVGPHFKLEQDVGAVAPIGLGGEIDARCPEPPYLRRAIRATSADRWS